MFITQAQFSTIQWNINESRLFTIQYELWRSNNSKFRTQYAEISHLGSLGKNLKIVITKREDTNRGLGGKKF